MRARFQLFHVLGVLSLKGVVALESPLSCSDVLKHTREIRSSWFNGINLCACFYVCEFVSSNSIGCPCRRT